MLWAGVAILVIILGAAALAIAATRDAARGQWRRGLVDLAGAGSMAVVGVLAARLAERRSGWTDTDRDGMLDGFANGAYDWFDINGTRWGQYSVAMAAAVMCVVLVMRRSLRSAPRRAP